jgi:hypothetical protein
MIYRDIIRGKWEVQLTTHAIMRAKDKGIYPFMIYATIKGGRIKKFGKNYVKFIMNYKKGTVICVGERKSSNIIKILTVECGSK